MLLQDAYKVGFELKVFSPYDVPLQPLTLGHVQILAELDVGIVWSRPEIKRHDIACILATCCFPDYQQARDELLENDDHVQRMIDHIFKHKRDDSQKAVDYMCYYLDRPKAKMQTDPFDARIPWWWSYAEFLQTEMGRGEKEAWNTICADAFCYYASFATRNGSEMFMTAREVYLDDMVSKGYTIKQMFEEGLL